MAAVNPVVTGFNLILPSVKCRLAHKFLVVLVVFMIVCMCVCVCTCMQTFSGEFRCGVWLKKMTADVFMLANAYVCTCHCKHVLFCLILLGGLGRGFFFMSHVQIFIHSLHLLFPTSTEQLQIILKRLPT